MAQYSHNAFKGHAVVAQRGNTAATVCPLRLSFNPLLSPNCFPSTNNTQKISLFFLMNVHLFTSLAVNKYKNMVIVSTFEINKSFQGICNCSLTQNSLFVGNDCCLTIMKKTRVLNWWVPTTQKGVWKSITFMPWLQERAIKVDNQTNGGLAVFGLSSGRLKWPQSHFSGCWQSANYCNQTQFSSFDT